MDHLQPKRANEEKGLLTNDVLSMGPKEGKNRRLLKPFSLTFTRQPTDADGGGAGIDAPQEGAEGGDGKGGDDKLMPVEGGWGNPALSAAPFPLLVLILSTKEDDLVLLL